jgi:hypothetical protein
MKRLFMIMMILLVLVGINLTKTHALSHASTTHTLGNISVSILDTYEKSNNSQVIDGIKYNIMEFTNYDSNNVDSFEGNIIDIITSKQENAGYYYINAARIDSFINSYTNSSNKVFGNVELVSKGSRKLGKYDAIYGSFILNDSIYNEVYCIINGKYSYSIKVYSSSSDFLDSKELSDIKESVKIDNFVGKNLFSLDNVSWGLLTITSIIFLYNIFTYNLKRKLKLAKSIKFSLILIVIQWLAMFGSTLNSESTFTENWSIEGMGQFIGYNILIIIALIIVIKALYKNKKTNNMKQ